MYKLFSTLLLAVTAAAQSTDSKIVSSNQDTWTGSTVSDSEGDVIMTTTGTTTWREPEADTSETLIYYNIKFEGQLQGDDVWNSGDQAGSWTCLELAENTLYSCFVITLTKNAIATVIDQKRYKETAWPNITDADDVIVDKFTASLLDSHAFYTFPANPDV